MIVTDIISSVLGIIDKIIPDPKQAAEAKLKLLELQQSGDLALVQASSQIVTAEAQSSSWLAANWRPLTALSFVTIIVNNYIIYPYLKLFGLPGAMMEIPPDMWRLLDVMLGGYVVSRGFEKIAPYLKGIKNAPQI
jgi:hypothetical protein